MTTQWTCRCGQLANTTARCSACNLPREMLPVADLGQKERSAMQHRDQVGMAVIYRRHEDVETVIGWTMPSKASAIVRKLREANLGCVYMFEVVPMLGDL